MFREDEKDDYEEKKSENMHNQQFFCGKNMLFYDEDRFLAKEEDFKQRS